jgi:hypothetical protein
MGYHLGTLGIDGTSIELEAREDFQASKSTLEGSSCTFMSFGTTLGREGTNVMKQSCDRHQRSGYSLLLNLFRELNAKYMYSPLSSPF